MRLIASVVCAALLVGACSAAPAADPEAPDPSGSLTTFLTVPAIAADPQQSGNSDAITVVAMVYEGLLRLDPLTGRPGPAAAQLPSISSDRRTYHFAVRQGQTYSDGSPLTASDFAYGLSRLCDPAIPAPYGSIAFVIVGCEDWAALDPAKASPDQLKAARDALFEQGLRVLGDQQLEIVLTRPAVYLPSFLALAWVSAPVRQRDVERGGERWWSDPARYIGNGPFVLSERIEGDRLVFVANKRARVPPRLARWTIRMRPVALGGKDAEWVSEQVEAYRRDEADVVGMDLAYLAQVEHDDQLKADLSEFAVSCTDYLRFDTTHPPFDDAKLRLALAKSIDRRAFVQAQGTRSRPATSLIPPGIPGHDEADPQRFDPQAARRLLAESAYGNGLFPVTDWPYKFKRLGPMNEWLAAQWKTQLGIDIRPRPVTPNEFEELLRRAETSPRLFRDPGWCTDYPDQQNWLSTLFHSKSQRLYANESFDRLVHEADGTAEQGRRDALYLSASRLLSEDAPAIWLAYGTRVRLKKPWVRLKVNALGYVDPADVHVVKRRP